MTAATIIVVTLDSLGSAAAAVGLVALAAAVVTYLWLCAFGEE